LRSSGGRSGSGGFEARTELGWAYEGDREPDWEVDLERFRAAALGLSERWERELKPRTHAITADLHRLRPEAVAATDATASLDRFWELVLEQWTIHFLAVVPAQAAIELFTDAYAETFGPSDPLAPYRLLDWLPNESTEADLQLWELATGKVVADAERSLRGDAKSRD
jgi:hypothetical protein